MFCHYRIKLRFKIIFVKKRVLCFIVTLVMFLLIIGCVERNRIVLAGILHINSLYNYSTPRIVYNSTLKLLRYTNRTSDKIRQSTSGAYREDLKYILLWTDAYASPFVYMGKGQSAFIDRKCKWTNCYVTDDRNYLGHYSEFEVIAFNGPQLGDALNNNDLPIRRSSQQKYVYANIESAVNYPIKTNLLNGFFNWTWTYKLNSDALWGYFLIKNATNHIVAPSVNMHWKPLNEMEPTGEKLISNLKQKSKPIAGYISHCHTRSHRENYIKALQEHLNMFNLQIDIYGECGTLECPKDIMERCLKYLKKNFFFYLAFENSCSDDYVTEKVVYALKYLTVPIVYGGANYSRFLPPGSYLDASQTNPRQLANEIAKIMEDPAIYYNFFRWKTYYSIHFRDESPDTDDYCHFCEMMNDKNSMKSKTVYEYFNSWWVATVTCSS